MTKTYDRDHATRLVPLLSVITGELSERGHNIRRLSRSLRALRRNGGQSTEILDVQAELATHRREVRLSLEELTKLGCIVDESNPTRVYIPGSDGKINGGYSWDAGADFVQSITTGADLPDAALK